MFGSQDANGPTRRGIVFSGCFGLLAFERIGLSNPVLGTISELLGAPDFKTTCPKEAATQDLSKQPGATAASKKPATPTAAAATVGAR